TDQAGGAHHAKLEFATLFGSVDQKDLLAVHYDPTDPSRYALSWAAQVTGWRHAGSALMFLIFGFMAGGCLYAAWRARRNARVAARGNELASPLSQEAIPAVPAER